MNHSIYSHLFSVLWVIPFYWRCGLTGNVLDWPILFLGVYRKCVTLANFILGVDRLGSVVGLMDGTSLIKWNGF